MIDALIRWAIKNRAATLLVAFIFTCFGGYTAIQMPVDVFPDLTAPTVTVITEAHGMAPQAVESQVTFPIEAALNGAPGVRRVRSSTAVGISVVWVEFEWGTDIYSARQIVSEKVSLIGDELPPEVEKPILAPISSIMGEVMIIGLSSKKHSRQTLRTTAETLVRRRLLAVRGVSQVTPIGGGRKQFQVVLSPSKLKDHHVSLQQVIDSMKKSNENVSAGFLNQSGSEFLVEGEGRLETLDDIAETVITVYDGVPVRIRELGTVKIGEAPKRGEASVDGQPSVILAIQKQPDTNTLTLTRELDKVLDKLESDLPEGMTFNRTIFRQSNFIEVAVNNVFHALRDGAILVVIIMVIFLANLRASLITLLAIPLSLVASVLTLKFFGASINTMTLGGMAIAIGALVDDAVIDVENVFRRLRENARKPENERQASWKVVYRASVEIRTSIVFATFIIVLVFIPLFFLSGVEGRLLKPLGLAYVVSLLASLVVAVTVTPALCQLLLPNSRAIKKEHEPIIARILKGAYGYCLRPSLRWPWLVTLPAVVLLGAAVYSTTLMGRSFLPEFNEGALTVAVVTLPGTSLSESDELGRLVEQTLLRQPEVISVGRRTGRAELDEHAQGVEASELDVTLNMGTRSKQDFLKELRGELAGISGANITIGQPISHRIDHMLSGTRANIAVKIYGKNLYKLRSLAEQAREAMSSVKGVVDLSVEEQANIPILKVKFDRKRIAKYGLTIEHVSHTLECAIQGLPVTRILDGQYSFDLAIKLKEDKDWTLQSIGELLVDTPVGARVPLKTLAKIKKDIGPNRISREQVERKIVVSCNVADRDIISVVQDCKKLVDPIVAKDSGYRVDYGGQFESANEASERLLFLGLAVFLGVAFLLHLAFGSVRDTIFVMLNLPLALIGGAAGVFLSGGVLSVASIIGFIAVFGVATRNGIMLISHIRNLQLEEGVTDFKEAVYRGSMERLIPILMTALASALALVPLALGGGKPGNEIQTPMAIVMLCGLTSSLILNMVVIPALYLKLGRPAKLKGESDEVQ